MYCTYLKSVKLKNKKKTQRNRSGSVRRYFTYSAAVIVDNRRRRRSRGTDINLNIIVVFVFERLRALTSLTMLTHSSLKHTAPYTVHITVRFRDFAAVRSKNKTTRAQKKNYLVISTCDEAITKSFYRVFPLKYVSLRPRSSYLPGK